VFYLFKHKVHKENTTQSTQGSNPFVLFVKNLCALRVKKNIVLKTFVFLYFLKAFVVQKT